MDHSPIAPSAASVWGKPGGCTGSVSMQARYPEDEKIGPAADGNAAHEIGEGLIDTCGLADWPDFEGRAAENGVMFTEEMHDAAVVYARSVGSLWTGDCMQGTETPLKMASIHPLAYGTCDAWVYLPETGTLYVIDFKYGHGIVEVFENYQLILYVAGVIDELSKRGVQVVGSLRVIMRIVQPRAWHEDGEIRDWEIDAADLLPYFETLRRNAHIALSDAAHVVSGEHCKNCTGRHACKAAQRAALFCVDYVGKPTPLELDGDALGSEFALMKRAESAIKNRLSGLEAQAEGILKTGGTVRGLTLAPGRGSTKWSHEADELFALGDMMGIELRKPTTTITPTQAKTAGLDAGLVAAYSEKIPGKLKVKIDNNNKAIRIFGK